MILSGRGRHLLEDESFPVAAGNVFVVLGNQVHSLQVIPTAVTGIRIIRPAARWIWTEGDNRDINNGFA